MTRMKIIPIAVVVILVQAACTATTNSFPFPNVMSGTGNGVGNGTTFLPFYQGWFEGELAWYILENGSNDFKTNYDIFYRTLFPKLGSTIGNAAEPVYVVLNFQQGPVFSSRPGDADYSALWQVIYITWKPGVTKRPVTSDLNLPTAAEADFTTTNIVVDRSIVAIGPLGGPWWPAPPGCYRLRQVRWYSPYLKMIEIPYWNIHAQDKYSRRRTQAHALIPDVADEDLASLLQANHAPGLATADPDNVQKLWVQDWTALPPPPPGQFPIAENLPRYGGNPPNPIGMNDNYDYTNIWDLQLFSRTTLPPYAIVNTPTFFQMVLSSGAVALVGSPVRVNGLIFVYFWY